MSAPIESEALAITAVRALVQRERDTCLWFLRDDFLPSDVAAALRVRLLIDKNGDRRAYAEARRLREWLLQISRDASAG